MENILQMSQEVILEFEWGDSRHAEAIILSIKQFQSHGRNVVYLSSVMNATTP